MDRLKSSSIANLREISSQKFHSERLENLQDLLRKRDKIEKSILDSTARLETAPSSINTAVDGALEAANNQSSVPKCVVEFTTLEAVDLSGYRLLRDSGIYGTLGLINIDADNFLCVISAAVRVASVRPDENVQKILSVEFYCLNRAAFDHQLTEDISQYQASHNSSDEHMYGHGLDAHETAMDHPCLELRKMLSGGTFYYSTDFDLTNRLQDRLSEGSAFDIDSLDEEFLWNAYMIDPLIKFRSRLSQNEKVALDHSRMLTSAIRGFVMTVTIAAAASPLKSLKSNYPSRLLPNQQKIQITRSPEATQSAFDKHFDHLELAYGAVHILNLMSATKSGEVELTMRYQQHVQRSPLNQTTGSIGVTGNRLMTSQFDFHAETKGPGGYEAASMVRRLIQDKADSFAYLLCDITDKSRTTDMDIRSNGPSRQESTVILQQEGIFRTNCLDCLDRTNLIQTIISQMALELFLGHRSERAPADFWVRHASLWADNGDLKALSKIYAGTGALKSSFTRHGKMSLAGAIADARKSATRLYINNFADKGRQITIDMLLVIHGRQGRLVEQRPVHLYDPINDHVASELQERTHEFSTSETICIWAGTFNLNGKGSGVREDLSAWLCPSAGVEPDIVAVGFQEIVELSPQQVMSTDPVRRQEWEEAVRLTINNKKKCASRDKYVLLRSGQLVGAALVVFVKSSALKNIKNVEGSVKKVRPGASRRYGKAYGV
ncbi:MAG: hypothetical protein L6R35_003742 [Caloplaca aegaea]|nr:MAG: hypothetical protein L6R35_003742 [Caloplaca aegaea]